MATYFSLVGRHGKLQACLLMSLIILSFLYIYSANESLSYNSANCDKTPNIDDLHYEYKYWQVSETVNATFYLYAAYYDAR